MKVIARQIYTEPAAAVGLLTTVALLVLALVDGAALDATQLIAIFAPLVSALGIRQAVSPAAGPRPEPPAEEPPAEPSP